MNIENLIAAKKAERRNAGLHIHVEFENREPFDRYPRDEAQRDEIVAAFEAMIGIPDEAGAIVKSVSTVQ